MGWAATRGFPASGNGCDDKRKAGSLTLEVPYSAFAPIVGGSFVKNCTPAAQNKTMVTDAMEMTQLALTEKLIFIDAFVQLNNQI